MRRAERLVAVRLNNITHARRSESMSESHSTKCYKVGCGEPESRFRGNHWICIVHNRFDTMTTCARDKGKRIPTYEELSSMAATLIANDMKCWHCGQKTQWAGKRSDTHTITLQHDRSGEIRFLCKTCNARHQFFPGDTFYDVPLDHKFCPKCKRTMHASEFYPLPNGKPRTYCKDCKNLIAVEEYRQIKENQKCE